MGTHRKISIAPLVAVLVSALFFSPLSRIAQPVLAQPHTSCQLTWSQVPAPNIPGAPVELTGISAYDTDHAGLAGRYRQPSGEYLPVVFYWDGSAWIGRNVPITSSYLFALQGIGPDNLFMLGPLSGYGAIGVFNLKLRHNASPTP